MYQENAEREKYREQAFTLREFLEGLQLRIDIAEAGENQLNRVSQLTFKTNQFNFTTIRRSESELRNLLRNGNVNCLVVKVRDRFGDYGLSGVVLYETESNQYKLDTFLLSCRVLGKGVEHFVLSEVGKRAQQEAKRLVEIRFMPSEKNAPAFEFIRSIGVEPEVDGAGCLLYKCPNDLLASLRYESNEQGERKFAVQPEVAGMKKSGQPTKRAEGFNLSGKMQRIADELYEANRITAAIDSFKLSQSPARAGLHEDVGSTMEGALLNIWRRVLVNPQVTVNDNFFEAGGTSLKAVMVIATIRKELKRNISVVTLFECPTVKHLAAKLSAPAQDRNGGTSSEARDRGSRRKQRARRRG